MAWHLGASQSDLAHLQAEDVDWQARIICFVRMKTRWRGQQPPQIRFGREVEEILASLQNPAPYFRDLSSRWKSTAPKNSNAGALDWGLKASRCTPTAMLGRNVQSGGLS